MTELAGGLAERQPGGAVADVSEEPELFRRAVAALSSVRPRPEIDLEVVRPPQRLAPWAFALAAEVNGPAGELATGRLVLLHDPDGEQAWGGVLRLVVYVRAELDTELATDPLLPAVGWSWLTEALQECDANHIALGGTVTQTSSARFGDISGPAHTDDLQLRASWTAVVETGPQEAARDGTHDRARLAAHGEAFSVLMASTAGLPPVGVTMLGRIRTP